VEPTAKAEGLAVSGRPSLYTAELADRICTRLAEGESLRAICRDEGYPAESTVRKWALEDESGFAAQYTRARELGYHALADEIIYISNTPQVGEKTKTDDKGTETTTGDMIEHRRLQVDARKWYLSKVLPKVYGEKQQVEHSGVIGIADALREARERMDES
jgi:hypothetical protein